MLSLAYLALVVVLFIIGFFTNVKLHRHIMAIVISWLVVALPLTLWLVWAKNNSLVDISGTGFSLTVLLFSKLLFVSTLVVFLWGWVKRFVLDFQISSIWPLLFIYVFIALSFVGIIFRQDSTNDFAFYSFIIGGVIISLSKLIYSLRFWVLQLLALLVFTVYSFLESLVTNIRFLDQFSVANLLFGFAFVGLFIVVFNWLDEKWAPAIDSSLEGADLGKVNAKPTNYSFIEHSTSQETNANRTVLDNSRNKDFIKARPVSNVINRPETSNYHRQKTRILRPSTKLASTLYGLRNRRVKDYSLQESYFKMPSFKFGQTHQTTKNK